MAAVRPQIRASRGGPGLAFEIGMATTQPNRIMLSLALACSLVVAAAAVPASQETKAPVRYTATAINMDPTVRMNAALVDLHVTRWSSDEERKQLLDVLVEKGQDRLLRALQGMPRAGTIKTPDSLTYDLRYARNSVAEDGGERIVLVTDREIAMWETATMSRTLDYPFMVIELHLDKTGHGEGKLTVATKLSVSRDGQIVMENYGTQPVRLSNVKREIDAR